MKREAEIYCRDQLKDARATVLKDSEAFTEVIYAIERTGAIAYGRSGNMQKYGPTLRAIASRSPLANDVPSAAAGFHTCFENLYDLVRDARNEALHSGSYARHLAAHAVELALVLEDGLVNGSDRVADYMVKAPVCAEPWQPVSLVRQQMLANAFSYLPIRIAHEAASEWRLISDLAIALYLAAGRRGQDRHLRLAHSVAEAEKNGLELARAKLVPAKATVSEVLIAGDPAPWLVVSPGEDLIGIVTPFDLL